MKNRDFLKLTSAHIEENPFSEALLHLFHTETIRISDLEEAS